MVIATNLTHLPKADIKILCTLLGLSKTNNKEVKQTDFSGYTTHQISQESGVYIRTVQKFFKNNALKTIAETYQKLPETYQKLPETSQKLFIPYQFQGKTHYYFLEPWFKKVKLEGKSYYFLSQTMINWLEVEVKEIKEFK